MRFAWRIREKLLISSVILVVVVSILSYSSFHGASLFRGLTKSIRTRAGELPLAAKLSEKVSELRVTFLRFSLFNQLANRRVYGGIPSSVGPSLSGLVDDEISVRQEFLFDLEQVNLALIDYQAQLEENVKEGRMLSDVGREKMTVEELQSILSRIAADFARSDWVFTDTNRIALDQALMQLQEQVTLLPGFLTQRMDAFHELARAEYKTWMYLSGMMSLAALACLGLLAAGIYFWILRPLRVLIRGSKMVASGNFDHRINVRTRDEVADLAFAMNQMTENFQMIRNDLDEQVRCRTKEVIRSDRLASVGFLAAGIAHEINNPLASIAWSAESVEKRFDTAFEMNPDEDDADVEFIRTYLSRIQQESFRCKGITERLLDFSRVGDSERQVVDLVKCVQGVIEMVQNLGRYREKKIWFESQQRVDAVANGQEVKQVLLNLLTNALDCVDKGGNVWLQVEATLGNAVITVKDDGCGMPQEVLEHVFEPFFTRREHGEGTGLGLSISHQIIADHGGGIRAKSLGVGKGAEFQVTLPLKWVNGKTPAPNGLHGTGTSRSVA
ncbi:MAG: ATP-binding protein [Pirellulaceae bacterium]|nr:ATP-binding protein [Pirellulaceae bacterium]